MKPKILLVNPPIYDFAAYDFWLKPYGLLQVGGMLRSIGQMRLFDYMDREDPDYALRDAYQSDLFGRGRYPEKRIKKPDCFRDIPRYYRRFGVDRSVFLKYLNEKGPFDFILIQSTLTYWYPGCKEVIDDIRKICPDAKIVIGGFYATACTGHAKTLGADLVIKGENFTPLWELLGSKPQSENALPAWELYPRLKTGILKLTRGCPFQCSYCYVPKSGIKFQTRPVDQCIAELEQLVKLGVTNIAFYDDALLIQPEKTLIPFLRAVINKQIKVNFHTPNALHARFLTAQLAELMVQAGFKTFYLGFESQAEDFHDKTNSGKVVSQELADAVQNLKNAGADPQLITAYEMLGHPKADIQQLEKSMRFAAGLGIRVMLSDFSPIPDTPDGELCRQYVDLEEPLNHSKTAFPIRLVGFEESNKYKDLCRKLNKGIKSR